MVCGRGNGSLFSDDERGRKDERKNRIANTPCILKKRKREREKEREKEKRRNNSWSVGFLRETSQIRTRFSFAGNFNIQEIIQYQIQDIRVLFK